MGRQGREDAWQGIGLAGEVVVGEPGGPTFTSQEEQLGSEADHDQRIQRQKIKPQNL